MYSVFTADFIVLYPWWISDSDAESPLLDDPMKLNEPMEWLVGRNPFVPGILLLGVDAVFSCKVPIELIFERFQAVAQFLLVSRCNLATEFGLLLAEKAKEAVDVPGFLRDPLQDVVKLELTLVMGSSADCPLDIFQGRKSH